MSYRLSQYPIEFYRLILPPEKIFCIRKRKYLSQKTKNPIGLIHKDIKLINHKIKLLKNEGHIDILDNYICPICGNLLNSDFYPMYFGDDYQCSCPVCRNTFIFGGTYPINYKLTSISELSENHTTLAYNQMVSYLQGYATRNNAIVLLSERMGIAVKKSFFCLKVMCVAIIS